MSLISQFLAWLAWLLFPVAVDVEAGKASAAVAIAASSMAEGASPGPRPTPPSPRPDVCPDCKGTGWIVHGDGHRTPCPCGITPNEPRPASASPATASPAVEIPRR
jgi:hypothetical protein